MNAVSTEVRGWKVVIGAVVVGAAGWWIVSSTSGSLGLSISEAFGNAREQNQPPRPSCADLSSPDQRWQSVELEFDAAKASQARIGSATVRAGADNADRDAVQWNSDLGIDAVITHQRHESTVHQFDEERFGGSHRAPESQEVEKLTLCYDLELTVNKDANPALTREYTWTIDETVEPSHWELPPGETGESTYQISVTRSPAVERAWRVRGTITIDNLTPSDAVLDEVADLTVDGISSEIDCPVPLPGYILESGESVTCEYRTQLPDASPRTATTFVRTDGPVLGATATSRVDFDRAEIEEVSDSIYVTDDHGRSWTFHETGTVSYGRTFRCAQDAGLHPTAARITGTDQQASAAVTVDCQPKAAPPSAARPSER